MWSYDSFPMHLRLVANALSDRSSVLNRDCFSSMFAQLTSYTMLLSLQNLFASLHTTLFKTHVMSKSGDKIGLVWSKIYMSKKCQFEDVTIIPLYYMPRSSLSCLLAFYGIPIFHTFLIRRIFYLFTCHKYHPYCFTIHFSKVFNNSINFQAIHAVEKRATCALSNGYCCYAEMRQLNSHTNSPKAQFPHFESNFTRSWCVNKYYLFPGPKCYLRHVVSIVTWCPRVLHYNCLNTVHVVTRESPRKHHTCCL